MCGNCCPIDHSATRLKRMMKMARISTQFSCRLDVIDDKFLGIYFLLVLGLAAEVGLAPDNVPIFCRGDSLTRLLRDNQVEKSLIDFFLHYSVEDTNLICIASVRLPLVYTCGLSVLFRKFLCTWPLSNQFFPAPHDIVDLSESGQGCL